VPKTTPKLLASPKRGSGNACAGALSTYPAEPRSVERPIAAICDSALLEAIARAEWILTGFRNRDIRSHIFKATPKNPRRLRRQSAAIGRRLRLLRAHRIIRKIPHTHRYTLTPYGRNLVTALLAVQHADTQKLTALAA